jgi:hypothetical protein
MASQRGENLLRHVGGKMRIAARATQCGAVNEIDVTVYQLGEGRPGIFLNVTAEQQGIIVHVVYLLNIAGNETEQTIARYLTATRATSESPGNRGGSVFRKKKELFNEPGVTFAARLLALCGFMAFRFRNVAACRSRYCSHILLPLFFKNQQLAIRVLPTRPLITRSIILTGTLRLSVRGVHDCPSPRRSVDHRLGRQLHQRNWI